MTDAGPSRAREARGADLGGVVPVGPARGEVADEVVRARVEATLERLARIDLQVMVVAPPDETRRAAWRQARDAAIEAGRRVLADQAIDDAREIARRSFGRAAFSGTWAATGMAVSAVSAADRASAAAALEEATLAAVVEDLVDPSVVATLQATTDRQAAMTGLTAPGSLSAIGSSARGLRGGSAWLGALAILMIVAGLAVGAQGGLVLAALGIVILVGLLTRARGGSG